MIQGFTGVPLRFLIFLVFWVRKIITCIWLPSAVFLIYICAPGFLLSASLLQTAESFERAQPVKLGIKYIKPSSSLSSFFWECATDDWSWETRLGVEESDLELKQLWGIKKRKGKSLDVPQGCDSIERWRLHKNNPSFCEMARWAQIPCTLLYIYYILHALFHLHQVRLFCGPGLCPMQLQMWATIRPWKMTTANISYATAGLCSGRKQSSKQRSVSAGLWVLLSFS